ncbi:MAG: FAD-dependent oxidoreductase [Spirochaetes bacterium]|nr:FAD-dependent oxidoreductase [Spirochaetota bacterium]
MKGKSIAIIGGGLSGLAAGEILGRQGFSVTLYEQDSVLGGVASNFTLPDGREIPRTYHQIVGTDSVVQKALDEHHILDRIAWSKIRIKFYLHGDILDLSNPFELLRYRDMSLYDKARFAYFGIRCLLKRDWVDFEQLSVRDLLLKWGNETIYETVFKPLVDIKFGIDPQLLSASWLGLRLNKREAKTPFGYLPDRSWTAELIESYRKNILENGGKIVLNSRIEAVVIRNDNAESIVMRKKPVKYDCILSTVAPQTLASLIRYDTKSPKTIHALDSLKKIEYISSYSLVAGVDTTTFRDYWTIAHTPRRFFGACFVLDKLNPTLANDIDKSVITCFTNIPYNDFVYGNDEYIELCRKDLCDMLKKEIHFTWAKLFRLQNTAPVFMKGYQNPDIRILDNMYLAGVYRTHPLLSSTGTAIQSGIETAETIIRASI